MTLPTSVSAATSRCTVTLTPCRANQARRHRRPVLHHGLGRNSWGRSPERPPSPPRSAMARHPTPPTLSRLAFQHSRIILPSSRCTPICGTTRVGRGRLPGRPFRADPTASPSAGRIELTDHDQIGISGMDGQFVVVETFDHAPCLRQVPPLTAWRKPRLAASSSAFTPAS